MRENVHEVATALGDLALPRFCVVCGRRLDLREKDLCLECLADLPLTHFWEYFHNSMSDRFNAAVGRRLPDGTNVPYLHAAALFFYNSDSGYRRIPQALKYKAAVRLGKRFSLMLGQRLAASGCFDGIDAVIPVPLHWTRRLMRGYNQAEVIARSVAESLGCPLVTGTLVRRRRTRSQTKVSTDSKAVNVLGAFCVRGGAIPYRHVLLVDDTFTTGATLAECAATIVRFMPPGSRISAASLAYVGH